MDSHKLCLACHLACRIVHALETYEAEAAQEVARWERNFAKLALHYQVLLLLQMRVPGWDVKSMHLSLGAYSGYATLAGCCHPTDLVSSKQLRSSNQECLVHSIFHRSAWSRPEQQPSSDVMPVQCRRSCPSNAQSLLLRVDAYTQMGT